MKAFTRVVVGMAGIACAIAGTTIPIAQAATTHHAAVARQSAVTHHSASKAPAWSQTFLLDCRGHGHIAPRIVVLRCADANDVLVHLIWDFWGSHTAVGHGIEAINTCIPNCAAGHFHHFRVVVTLWGVRPWRGHPFWWRFTHLTISYMGRSPRLRGPCVVIPIGRHGPFSM